MRAMRAASLCARTRSSAVLTAASGSSASRRRAPTVCVRVPEQIVIDLRADPKVMQVPTLEIQQPSPRPPKALAPSK